MNAVTVCVPCERERPKELQPLREMLKLIHPFQPAAAESMMEYFEALHARDFERAERMLKRMRDVSYYEWMKFRPWGPFEEAGETEEHVARRWEKIVEAIGHAIWPGDPARGIQILEQVAWTHAPRPIYKNIKTHYSDKKPPGSMIKIYRTFAALHEHLTKKIGELETKEGQNH